MSKYSIILPSQTKLVLMISLSLYLLNIIIVNIISKYNQFCFLVTELEQNEHVYTIIYIDISKMPYNILILSIANRGEIDFDISSLQLLNLVQFFLKSMW